MSIGGVQTPAAVSSTSWCREWALVELEVRMASGQNTLIEVSDIHPRYLRRGARAPEDASTLMREPLPA